jgi:hypothetical protein
MRNKSLEFQTFASLHGRKNEINYSVSKFKEIYLYIV